MREHQKRVVEEKEELDAKIEKLKTFITTNGTYLKLPIEDQFLLSDQFWYMSLYSDVLSRRIERFE